MGRIGDGFNRALQISAYIPGVSTITCGTKAIVGGASAVINKAKRTYYLKKADKCFNQDEKHKYNQKALNSRVKITTGLKGLRQGSLEAVPIIGNIYAGVRDYQQSKSGHESPTLRNRAGIPPRPPEEWQDTDL